MSMIKSKIYGNIYDVISLAEYNQCPEQYGKFNAIDGGDGYIYPIRSINDNRPGFYPTGCMDFFRPPTIAEQNEYSKNNVINFRDATTLKEIIETQQKLTDAERTILTTVDNVFAPEIGIDDMPEMALFKKAVGLKHIDIDKYESRIGPNFNNDKRLMKKRSMTFNKFRSLGRPLDMKITLTIEDASPDVPNPIGEKLSVEITGSSFFDQDEEE